MPKLAVFPKAYMKALCKDGSMKISEWVSLASKLDIKGLEWYAGFLEKRDKKRWKDIKKISIDFNIMSDVILNHASKSNKIFKKYLLDKKEYQNFFLSVSDNFDTSKVVRPREHNLIQNIHTDYGIKKLWCTFSNDQIDFNFLNHKVLEFFLNVINNFVKNGVRIIRLDAVGFLWKESNTECLNLPQTHSIIKILRNVVDSLNIKAKIVTETNLPRKENLSYFGDSDEAHWIYNFSLAPLLVYTLLFENCSILSRWSKSMPPSRNGSAYLNSVSYTHLTLPTKRIV